MNVYQMYKKNGYMFGFIVQRDSWGNTLAKVVGIEGVVEGQPIKGKSPYYGNPKVFVDVYSVGGLPTGKVSGLSCPGTFSYELVEM